MTSTPKPPFRMAIVGCGAKKAPDMTVASELYQGDLFKKSYAHAVMTHGAAVGILSAHYGFMLGHQVVAPYDLTIGDLDEVGLQTLGDLVARQLENRILGWGIPAGHPVDIDVYAGEVYRAFLVARVKLPGRPVTLNNVFGRKQIGERLQWLKQELTKPRPTVPPVLTLQ